MSQIRAVIFDMDGVLIDAKEWHYEALNRALELFGFTISRYEHLGGYNGLPTRKKLEMLTRDHGLPRCLHTFVNELKQQYTLEMIEAQCRPRDNHQRALSLLSRQGYVLGLASNSVRHTVQRMMQLSGLDQHLRFMLSNQDVARPKPDPEIYQAAAELAGFAPGNCVVVEDNPHGVEAARNAGAHVLQVDSVDEVTYERITAFIRRIELTSGRAAFRRDAA